MRRFKDNNGGIEKFLRIIIGSLASVFIMLALIGNIFYGMSESYCLAAAIFFIVISAIAYILRCCRSNYRVWLLIIFLLAFILRMTMLCVWPIVPASDFEDTYEAATLLSRASATNFRQVLQSQCSYYYAAWPQHIPFILIQMLIIRLFGEGYYAMQIIFNVFSAASCVLCCEIGRELYGKRAGVLAGIIMSILPIELMCSALLTNQHMATFFFLLSIYFLVANPIWKMEINVVFCALSAVISQIIRPEMIVYVIAVICYFIYKYFSNEISTKRLILCGIMFLAVYFAAINTISFFMVDGKIAKGKITQTNYKYKIVVGLNTQNEGRWNEEDFSYANDEQMLDELIKQRTRDKGQLMVLAIKKIMRQYGTYDYPWCIDENTPATVQKWYRALVNAPMLIILLFSLVKVIMSSFKKTKNEALILITMLGYFLIYSLIEVQNRYNYFMIPLFVVLSSGQIIKICEKIKAAE